MPVERSGYWLTKIRLHHWHAYFDEEIEIPLDQRGLHLTGDTGVGKSTIVDGAMWALIGDQTIIRFNQAATQDGKRSSRNLLGYVRGELPDGYLRHEGTAHTLLEFTHYQSKKILTVGSLIDYDELDARPCFFVAEDQPLTIDLVAREAAKGTFYFYDISEFRRIARRAGDKIHIFSHAKEYREILCQYFGNLSPRFFQIISRLSGQQSLDVKGVLFDEKPIEIDNLRNQVIVLRETEIELHKTQQRLNQLEQIQKTFDSWEIARQQQALFGIYKLQFELEKLQARLQVNLCEIGKLEDEIKAKTDALRIDEDEKKQAQAIYEACVRRQEAEGRNSELKVLERQHAEKEVELGKVSARLDKSHQAVTQLKDWLRVLPTMLTALVDVESLTLEVSPSVENLSGLISKPEINVDDISSELVNLSNWVVKVESDLEHHQAIFEGEIRQTKADLGEAEAGRIPNEYAYKVKDHLSQHGQVEVLCDLIDSVDREWQPIIERIMGGRRFTLITTEANYSACLKTFRSLSNEITDGVHLARPKDALPYGEAAAGSLAEKVTARNRIGQGLLNRHLNSLQAYENDDKAVEASVSVATRTGIIVRGGTIQRLTPLPRNKLVFDRAAREEQRKELEAKLKQLLTRKNVLDQKLSGLDPLRKKISQQINATKLIDPDLAQQEAQFQTDLAALAAQIKVIKEAANFILLEEEKHKADANFQSITKKCNELEIAITRSQDTKKGLEQSCEEDGRIFQSLENQLISFNDIEWQPTYQEVRISSSTTGQDFARFLETEKPRWDNEVVSTKSKLEGQVRDYIAKSSPTLSWRPFQEQLQACLEECQRLQELELKKLSESQQQLRAEAERILKTTFFDALLRAHGEIEKGIRRLNKAIQKVKLGRRSYRFTKELIKTTEVKNVWELVQSYNKLKPEQLGMDFTNQIFDTQRELIDRLLELFVPPEEKLAVEQSHIRRTLLTPVKYFEFDIEATEDGQKWFLLSRQYGKGSGGEHQNPLYILLAGAMLQFYEDHPDRPRFVIIDEAFGKAPFSAVNGLEMLLNEGLQPIVSTVLNQPQVEEVIGYTIHISRPSTDMGKNKKIVHVVTNPKAKLFAK